MAIAINPPATSFAPAWRELVWPREHGSWSLAFEPVVLGLLVAPSLAGLMLGLAIAAAFFARRPLRAAVLEPAGDRRDAARIAAAICAAGAMIFFLLAIVVGGAGWTAWLLPSLAAGAVFLHYDLRRAGREEVAEIGGAAAFAFIPAALAAAARAPTAVALPLALVMCARSVPTVLFVRAAVRAKKSGVSRPAPALLAAATAFATCAFLWWRGFAPAVALFFAGLFALRTVALLGGPRQILRARSLGIIEAVLGVGFVLLVALAWRA